MITCSFTILINDNGGYLNWHQDHGVPNETERALAESIRAQTRKAWYDMASRHPDTTEIIQAADVSEETVEAMKKRITG